MNPIAKIHQLVAGHREVYPGQIQEIIGMTNCPGCDICEHVPTLVEYGRRCRRITEFGVRFGWSTRSFLFAEPKSMLSVDLYQWNSVHQCGAPGPLTQSTGNTQYLRYKALYEGVVDFQYLLGDTMHIDIIPPTDLLFIDSNHHRDCTKIELEKHGNQASKYIILHDTETYGRQGMGEASLPPLYWELGPGTGVLDGLEIWLSKNPHWKIKEHYSNNNGLTVLERTQ